MKLIDTDAAIEAVCEEVMDRFFVPPSAGYDVAEEALKKLPSIQPETNCSEIPNNSDTISRQHAIDALKTDMASLDHIIKGMSAYDVRLDAYVSQRNQVDCDIDTISNLPSAQPEQQNARIFQGVIVEYPTYSTYPEYEGKPYFLIKYTEDGQDFIGYGTYKPDVLSEYLKKYFMPSAQPDIITCGDCKRYIRHDKRCGYWNHGVKPTMWCSQAKRREVTE